MFFDLPTSDALSRASELARSGAPKDANATDVVAADSAGSLDESAEGLARRFGTPQPGRVRAEGGVQVQDEYEWQNMCTQRAEAGYNSGMGEIFRKVAEISSPAGAQRALPP